MSACLTKTSFLVSFWSMACPLTLSCWRAAVFWPCKGSIIISSLIVIWYEWLDETWAVLEVLFIEFGFWVKILRCFYGTRRPYRIWHLFIQSTVKHNTYQLWYIYSIPPDDGLQICPKHVKVEWRNRGKR